jgi:hypothetical protein
MPSPARYRALQWFRDHEALGPDGVFNRKPPSGRMRNMMAADGQVAKEPVGQFKYQRWLLTAKGREVLEAKPAVRRRCLPRIRKAKKLEGDA